MPNAHLPNLWCLDFVTPTPDPGWLHTERIDIKPVSSWFSLIFFLVFSAHRDNRTSNFREMTTPTKRHSLPPRPLHLSISTIDTFSRTSSGSDIVSSSPTTSSLSKRPATKRQQSISYLPHNSDPRWSIRSPTAAASPLSISPEGRNSPASPASQRENTPLTLAEKCVYHFPI